MVDGYDPVGSSTNPMEGQCRLASAHGLGHYSVTAKIGEGGRDEVYQARDTKLDRDVALKDLLT